MKAIARALRQLWPQLQLRWWTAPALITLGLCVAISEGFSISLIVPLLAGSHAGSLGHFFDIFNSLPENQRVPAIAACMLGGIILKNVLSYGYGVLFVWTNTGIAHRLRCAILEQLLGVSPAWMETQNSSKLLNTLGSETWRMSSALSVLADMIITVCMVLIFGVLLFVLSWKLAVVCGLFFLGVSAITRIFTGEGKQLGEAAVKANESFAHRMLEIFNGLRVVRTFGREKDEQDRFEEASSNVRKAFFRMDRLATIIHPISEILTAVLLVFMMVPALKAGQLPTMLTFLVVLYRLQARVKALESQKTMLAGFSASIEEVRKLLDRSDKPFLASGSQRIESVGDIEFRNVSLKYPTAENPSLHDVTFTLAAGKTTALVGASGAGKSSLVNLLCRFYDPDTGSIQTRGCNLKDLDLAWWRNQIALVSQDIHLFNASVAENIGYGKSSATRTEIEAAARKAHAEEFIRSLPEGFDTILGDRGMRLSGGERQRLALARALIRDPKVLILDEATNALDATTEKIIQQALVDFCRDRIVLMIAHRLRTVESADYVVVLDKGQIAEQGERTKLLLSGGLFQRLRALDQSTDGLST